ncbi:MAG: serine hydrolase domain-containing protein [Thermoplasmata archaeon]
MARKNSLPALEWIIRTWQRKTKTPGLGLGLAHNGNPVVRAGFGFRDLKARLPVSPGTVFGIASMTKSFTAMAILLLEERGHLHVTDRVKDHLPEFRTNDPRWTRQITLHHFLTHSSGLPPLPFIYYTSRRSLATDPPYDPRVARRVGIEPDHPPIDTYGGLMEALARTRYRPIGRPGERFSYCNEGFGLLGAVIENVSGRRYESFVTEEILEPAGMTQSGYDPGQRWRSPELSTLYQPDYQRKGNRVVPSQIWWEDPVMRGTGGLHSTVDDILRYLEILRTGGRIGRKRLLQESSLRRMMTPYLEVEPGVRYGYGLMMSEDADGHRLVFHGGGLKGVGSILAVVPELGITAVGLANYMFPGPVVKAGLNHMIGRPLATSWETLPPIRNRGSHFRDLEGWYGSGEGWWVRVRCQAKTLEAHFHGIEIPAKKFRFRHEGDDQFVMGRGLNADRVWFLRTREGRPWAVRLGSRVVRRRTLAEVRRARTGRLAW